MSKGKVITLIIITAIVMYITGIIYTVNTMKVDIVSDTETGSVVRITVLDQWFNHYCEKGDLNNEVEM